jgi:hypothetical protein
VFYNIDHRLMQMIHLNNVDAMKFMRLSKSPVDVDNIKQTVAKDGECKKTTVSGEIFTMLPPYV